MSQRTGYWESNEEFTLICVTSRGDQWRLFGRKADIVFFDYIYVLWNIYCLFYDLCCVRSKTENGIIQILVTFPLPQLRKGLLRLIVLEVLVYDLWPVALGLWWCTSEKDWILSSHQGMPRGPKYLPLGTVSWWPSLQYIGLWGRDSLLDKEGLVAKAVAVGVHPVYGSWMPLAMVSYMTCDMTHLILISASVNLFRY